MKKTIQAALLVVVTTISLAANDALAREVKSERQTVDAAGLDSINIEHPVGDLQVIGTSGNRVTIEMSVSCGRWFAGSCREKADRLELSVEQAGDVLFVRIDEMPNTVKSLSIDMEIRVPRRFAAEIEHGVGDTRVTGLRGDVSVELGVGDVMLTSEARWFRSVSLEAGVGDVDLRVSGRRGGEEEGFLFLGNEIEWRDGKGQSHIEVEVGVGEADVRLD